MAVKGSVKFGPLTPRFAFLEHVIAPLSPQSATIFALQRIAVDRIMLREVLALGALMVGMCGLLLGNGLFGTLTALRMSGEGFDPTIIGIVLSCHSLGFIVGCLYGQRIIRRTGYIHCFTAFAALLAVVCLVLPIVVTPATWIPLRLIFGFCSAMVFMVAESWLTGAASSETKGRVFAVYMVINKGSFGAVPLSYWPVIALSFVIGGLSAVVYPIAMAHANDHARVETLVSIMAGLLLTFGVGASISPFFASLAIKWLGPAGCKPGAPTSHQAATQPMTTKAPPIATRAPLRSFRGRCGPERAGAGAPVSTR